MQNINLSEICSLDKVILNNCTDIITVKDLNYNYITCNTAFCQLFDTTDETKILHKNINDLFSSEICNTIRLKTKQVFDNGENVSFSLKHKEKTYNIYLYPIKQNEKTDGVLTFALDCTKEKAENSQKEMFIATLAHDLKTPLLAQIKSLEMLKKGIWGSLNNDQTEIISVIIESSEFMKQMLYSLLEIYRFKNGKILINPEKFDLEILIQSCIKEILGLAKSNNINIKYTNLCADTIINGDKTLIKRVILNLLDNSINYAYKNSQIDIFINSDEKLCVIKIKNTGSEIKKEFSQHIFEKYVTGQNLNQKPGVGLGLYYCKTVVEAHNGKIIFNNDKNLNEFIIEIPKEFLSVNYLQFI